MARLSTAICLNFKLCYKTIMNCLEDCPFLEWCHEEQAKAQDQLEAAQESRVELQATWVVQDADTAVGDDETMAKLNDRDYRQQRAEQKGIDPVDMLAGAAMYRLYRKREVEARQQVMRDADAVVESKTNLVSAYRQMGLEALAGATGKGPERFTKHGQAYLRCCSTGGNWLDFRVVPRENN